jgi:2-dehydro-3-deoxyphosphogluconate aldolase / (4S)-4-hydroxy-2-oxoglutarate aldolase
MSLQDEITAKMRSTGIVPLFTPEDADEAFLVVRAAYLAGIRAFEITNRRANSFDVFSSLVRRKQEFPDLSLGVGTILEGATTQRFIDAGAEFIISPIMNIEMGKVCRQNDIPWMPGCGTLTEIITARDHGAHVIKLFPGSVLGVSFVSAILPVVPDLKLMITGGVEPTEESFGSWFKAGAFCLGLGSHLVSKEMLIVKDSNAIEMRIRTAVKLAGKFI